MLKRQTLLIDADDTLWENNIYFREAMGHFLSIMEGLGFAQKDIRVALTDMERHNIKIRGYGSKKFIVSMKETFLMHCGHENRLCTIEAVGTVGRNGASPSAPVMTHGTTVACEIHCGEEKHQCLVARIEAIGSSIAGRPVLLLSGVSETLRELSARHTLIMFTKGDPHEQRDKVERSGLAPYFTAVEIAREKNCEAYLEIIERHGLDKESTWMVGNSPRSDINPATQAGIRSVFIPHPCTWELEEEPILRPERVKMLREFRDLLTAF